MTDTVRVPREPTPEMLKAGASTLDDFWKAQERGPTHVQEAWPGIVQIYAAMLAASPQGAGSSADAQGWRDIATAPRDGTMLLVGYDEGVAREGAMEDRQRVFEARWNDVQGTWSARNGFLLHSDATHWQPLPPPPSAHPAPIKPSADTGELRDRVARVIHPKPWSEDYELADAILDLIQSERAG